jgi:hypothetical protein
MYYKLKYPWRGYAPGSRCTICSCRKGIFVVFHEDPNKKQNFLSFMEERQLFERLPPPWKNSDLGPAEDPWKGGF